LCIDAGELLPCILAVIKANPFDKVLQDFVVSIIEYLVIEDMCGSFGLSASDTVCNRLYHISVVLWPEILSVDMRVCHVSSNTAFTVCGPSEYRPGVEDALRLLKHNFVDALPAL
jgi:hypothetical protein